MIPIHKIIGRLSNQMFEFAALYAWTQDQGIPFFVQDEKYFKKYEKEIRRIFGEGIYPNSVDRVAIHRRLTDYVGNSYYVDLGHHQHQDLADNYFVRAMAEFPEGTQFTIFSDDIETAKKEPMFQGTQFQFSEGRSDVEDMNYMANHKGLIGSNSSFAWWAAWLGEAPGRKVIMPKQWFSDSANEQFIRIPERWMRL